MKKTIQVYEHSKLRIGQKFGEKQVEFKEKHFNALTSYNDKHGKEFFKVGHKHIQFTTFVGVIQVMDLTIEIMPKIDLKSSEIESDKKHLIDMLRVCRNVPLSPTENARQKIRKNTSLLDLFFIKFLDDTEFVLHRGLKKRYLKEQSNKQALKGKIIFPKHIRKNLVHKEQFFTEHSIYNRDMVLNQLLKKALLIIVNVTRSSDIKTRASNYLLFFENIRAHENTTSETFRKIRFTRHNEYYRESLTLAEMIILQYSPQISGGKTPVLAILFQMHRLFEEFVYRKFKRMLPEYVVRDQVSSLFWKRKRVKPDIIIEKDKHKVIFDTKWKFFNGIPKDQDIQQMFIYCKKFGLKTENTFQKAFLVYPGEKSEIVVEAEEYHEHSDSRMGVIQISVTELLKNEKPEFFSGENSVF